jgi:hypothetical protein
MEFSVQTRLLKLVSCKPEDQTSCMMRRHRDAFVNKNKKTKKNKKKAKQMLSAFNISRHKFRSLNALESQCSNLLLLLIAGNWHSKAYMTSPFFSAYCYVQLHRIMKTLLSFWAWSSCSIINTNNIKIKRTFRKLTLSPSSGKKAGKAPNRLGPIHRVVLNFWVRRKKGIEESTNNPELV